MIDYGAGAYGRTAYGQWTDRTDADAAAAVVAVINVIGGATFGGNVTVTAVAVFSDVASDRIKDGAATISSDSGSLYGLGTYGSSSFGSDFGVLTVNWERIMSSGAAVVSVMTPTAVAKIIYQSDGTAAATTTTSADSDVVVTGQAALAAAATLDSVEYLRIRYVSGSATPSAVFDASGRHKWEDITSSTLGAWTGEIDADVTWTNLNPPYR